MKSMGPACSAGHACLSGPPDAAHHMLPARLIVCVPCSAKRPWAYREGAAVARHRHLGASRLHVALQPCSHFPRYNRQVMNEINYNSWGPANMQAVQGKDPSAVLLRCCRRLRCQEIQTINLRPPQAA